MRHLILLLPLAVALASLDSAADSPAEEAEARQVVRLAVDTQGGLDRLKQITDAQFRLRFKGTGKNQVELLQFQMFRAPDKVAMVSRPSAKADSIKVFDGQKGSYMRRGGKRVLQMTEQEKDEMRAVITRARLLLLHNLLVDGARFELLSKRMGFTVRWTGEGDVLTLRFDKHYLLQQAWFGKDKKTRARFADFEVFDGVRLPRSIVIDERQPPAKGSRRPTWDTRATIALTHVKFPRKLPARLFADPRVVAQYIGK